MCAFNTYQSALELQRFACALNILARTPSSAYDTTRMLMQAHAIKISTLAWAITLETPSNPANQSLSRVKQVAHVLAGRICCSIPQRKRSELQALAQGLLNLSTAPLTHALTITFIRVMATKMFQLASS